MFPFMLSKEIDSLTKSLEFKIIVCYLRRKLLLRRDIMRFLLLTFLAVLVSCGQGSSSSKNGGSEQRQNEEYVTEVREVDLLDVAMDVPVEISGNKIIFKQAATDSANGVRSSCSVGVASGEAYDFSVSGSTLSIRTASGERMNLQRVSGDNGSIVGSWTGKSYNGEQLVMRRMTFVSENRLVMRTHCES